MLLGVLGVVAIAVTNSVAADMLVAQEEQLNGLEASYSNDVDVPASKLDSTIDPAGISAFYRELSERIGPQDADVALQAQTSMKFLTGQERDDNLGGTGLLVKWTLGDISQMQRIPVVSGSLPGANPFPPSLALNQPAAELLGVPGEGQFYVSQSPQGSLTAFTVTGIVADGQQSPIAYAPYEAALQFFPSELVTSPTTVRVRASTVDEAGVDSLIKSAASNNGFILTSETTRKDTVESVRSQLEFFRLVFGGCAMLVLVIAAMATTSVGIASVTERSRELVVRRAVGARRRDIFAQVMWASLAVGIVVAFLAIVGAVVGVFWVVPALIPVASSILPPTFPWFACVLGVLAALTTSALGAVLPALKATRLPVALALRE
ncbi:ABC transporter permease [Salinibacterium hongtaonis]|uniref:ABC transporter permease n=1 Tax=Homoserinimonas hongtaonis TaxID=2079791 RepID=UPI000D3D5231|nr:FtsX-like permease family protein [Salinibacterium hongtaonis]AWB88979.1 hypothetical protein C2138_04980 [Salinibacterium hongtaonis]